MKTPVLASMFFYEEPTAEHLEDLEKALRIATESGKVPEIVAKKIANEARKHYNEMQRL